jgi:hypothetical protein
MRSYTEAGMGGRLRYHITLQSVGTLLMFATHTFVAVSAIFDRRFATKFIVIFVCCGYAHFSRQLLVPTIRTNRNFRTTNQKLKLPLTLRTKIFV